MSGQTCKEAVVSPRSGGVFERRIIEKYLAEHSTDPITGDALQVDELISLRTQSVAAPRVPTATSIPSLLQLFQSEWDSVMLECFELKRALDDAKKDLVTALYEKDAAVRVIARVCRERDEARNALTNVGAHASAHHVHAHDKQPDKMDAESAPLAHFRQTIEENANRYDEDARD